MSQSYTRRILGDMRRMSEYNGIFATVDSNNISLCDAVVIGPSSTIWEHGVFRLKVTFTNNYPAEPPMVKFLSSIYHPNVYKDGKICLDILTKKEWKPVYDLGTVLTSIRSLLCDPNPKDPANCDAAYEYIYDRHLYEMKVRECVRNSWLNPYDVYKKEE